MPRIPLISLLALALATPLAAQDPLPRQLSARVTGRDAERLVLDVGSESGVAVGDRVVLLPSGADPVEAVVQEVTDRSAKVELLQAAQIDLGARATVYASAALPEGAERPPHPGWERPPEAWNEELPLLAPARVDGTAARRPTEWRGRAFVGYDRYDDRVRTTRGSQSLRSGVDLDAWNLFTADDVFGLDVEYRRREVVSADGSEDVDGRLRLDRLYYGQDATRDGGGAWRAGRFLQMGVPEFGVLDGIEIAHLPPLGVGAGASVGWKPQLYGDFSSFEDLQASAYTRWTGAGGAADAGVGVQKTWDDGESDRDLMLVEAAWRPRGGFHAYGTAWLDWYASDERVGQGSGLEVTQAFLGTGWRGQSGVGVLLSASRVTFPALTRDQGFLPPTGDPLDLRNDRLRLDAWLPLGTSLRSGFSAWRWDDESDTGGGGELRLDASRLAGGVWSLGGALYADQGLYADLVGVRLHTRVSSGIGGWSLTWRGEDVESALPGGGGTPEGFHQSVRVGWDLDFASGWSLSLWYQQDDGNEQDAGYGGFWLQRRF